MNNLLKTAMKLGFLAILVCAVIFGCAWLASIKVISSKTAAVLIFSIPFWGCLWKVCRCVLLMRNGIPTTGFFSVGSRIAHLRYQSADGVEHQGSCDLLTRRVLKKGQVVPVRYNAKHPAQFTTGQREIIVNAMFCILFAAIPIFLLIRL